MRAALHGPHTKRATIAASTQKHLAKWAETAAKIVPILALIAAACCDVRGAVRDDVSVLPERINWRNFVNDPAVPERDPERWEPVFRKDHAQQDVLEHR
jgi:hypothetical protein